MKFKVRLAGFDHGDLRFGLQLLWQCQLDLPAFQQLPVRYEGRCAFLPVRTISVHCQYLSLWFNRWLTAGS